MAKRSSKQRKSSVNNRVQEANSNGNRLKKAKNIFKITDNKHTKKAKEVHGNLKQVCPTNFFTI